MTNVAFNGEDGEIEMELSNMTVALWREKLAAGTCGAFGPPPPKEYPIMQNPDGEDLVIKLRSVNKTPYLIVLENKKQILQMKIEEERGEEATAEIALAVMSMYSKGTIKKVEMRVKKNELMKASDKHILPPAHAPPSGDTKKHVEGKGVKEQGMASAEKGPTEDAEEVKFDGGTVPAHVQNESASANSGMGKGKGDPTAGSGKAKGKGQVITSPKKCFRRNASHRRMMIRSSPRRVVMIISGTWTCGRIVRTTTRSHGRCSQRGRRRHVVISSQALYKNIKQNMKTSRMESGTKLV